jgi:hypothetical protein
MPSAKRLDDLELQVGSPGMGRPFRVQRQYRSTGRGQKGGRFHGGRQPNCKASWRLSTTTGITLRIEQPSKVKGRQPKLSDETTVIPFTEHQVRASHYQPQLKQCHEHCEPHRVLQ